MKEFTIYEYATILLSDFLKVDLDDLKFMVFHNCIDKNNDYQQLYALLSIYDSDKSITDVENTFNSVFYKYKNIKELIGDTDYKELIFEGLKKLSSFEKYSYKDVLKLSYNNKNNDNLYEYLMLDLKRFNNEEEFDKFKKEFSKYLIKSTNIQSRYVDVKTLDLTNLL